MPAPVPAPEPVEKPQPEAQPEAEARPGASEALAAEAKPEAPEAQAKPQALEAEAKPEAPEPAPASPQASAPAAAASRVSDDPPMQPELVPRRLRWQQLSASAASQAEEAARAEPAAASSAAAPSGAAARREGPRDPVDELDAQVEELLQSPEIDDRAAHELRTSSDDVKRRVIARGGITSARNPSAAILVRIKDAKVEIRTGATRNNVAMSMGLPTSREVDDFIKDHRLSREASKALRSSSPTVKRRILCSTSIADCPDPNAYVLGMIPGKGGKPSAPTIGLAKSWGLVDTKRLPSGREPTVEAAQPAPPENPYPEGPPGYPYPPPGYYVAGPYGYPPPQGVYPPPFGYPPGYGYPPPHGYPAPPGAPGGPPALRDQSPSCSSYSYSYSYTPSPERRSRTPPRRGRRTADEPKGKKPKASKTERAPRAEKAPKASKAEKLGKPPKRSRR